jgi:hypothetical protein
VANKDDSNFGLFVLFFLLLLCMPFYGGVSAASKATGTDFDKTVGVVGKVLIWLLIRSIWFGLGAGTTYLCMR